MVHSLPLREAETEGHTITLLPFSSFQVDLTFHPFPSPPFSPHRPPASTLTSGKQGSADFMTIPPDSGFPKEAAWSLDKELKDTERECKMSQILFSTS